MKGIHSCIRLLVLYVVVSCSLGQPFNNTTGEECSDNSDCASDKICVDLKCVDPCLGVCGTNTICVVQDLQPVCACKPGYEGHPFTGCTPGTSLECTQNGQCPQDKACMNNRCVDPCVDSCGVNSECRVVNHRHMCACRKGFFYNPEAGCQAISSPQCQTSAHCPDHLVCRKQHCVDPCDGVCGNNTICSVKNHHPACACVSGFSGNAFEGCHQQCMIEKRVIGKKQFILVNEKKNWLDAVQECYSRGMFLATVDNEEEQTNLKELLQSTNPTQELWLGAHDLGEFGKFIWIKNGRELSYKRWKSNEPQGTQFHCLLFDSLNGWMSQRCEEQYKFACESNDHI